MNRFSIERGSARAAGLSLLLILPAIYFVTLNILKYELGFLPELEVYPVPPLILLGGAFLALVVNLYSLVSPRVAWIERSLQLILTVQPRLWNLLVVASASLLLAAMLLYAIVENFG